MTALAGTAGAALVGGLLLAVLGLRRAPAPPPRPPRRRRLPSRTVVLGSLAAGLLVLAVTGWPVLALTAATAAAGVPRLRGAGPAAAGRTARLEALAGWTRRLADILAAGAGGLEHAIAASARSCPAPIAAQVTALARRLTVEGPEPALRSFADDLDDPAGDLVAAALILRARHGGRGLRGVLDALAADVAEQVRMRREVDADRAKPRTNARALAGITA
ncbi:MAG TPA: hypothetical protein VEL73_09130, partial [Mycobacteriales bacterium]|nr:hypothetical protein [Mycobacteriales bacterium]